MGGLNETMIEGLRLHINNSDVHIHDDTKSLKFIAKKDIFKKDVEAAIKDLNKTKNDGLVKIEGSSGKVYILKENQRFSLFMATSTSIRTQLEKFIKEC